MEASFFEPFHDQVFSHPLFRRLNTVERKTLREYYILQEYLKGERIVFDGDIVESLYLVLAGSVSHVNGGSVHSYWTGDFWGIETLQTPWKEEGVFTAREDCVILRLRAEGFRRFTARCPGSREAFRPRKDSSGRHVSGFPDSQWRSIESRRKSGVFEGRTSIKSFSLFMIIPVSGIMAGIQLSSRTPWSLVLTALGLFVTVCEIFLRNMTLYRVSEKTAFRRFFNWRYMKMEQEEIPLDQVKSVNINVKGIFRQIFKIGDLSIQTPGRGIVFRNIDRPEDLQKTLMDLRQRKQFEMQGEQREEFRKLVRDNLISSKPEIYSGVRSSRLEDQPETGRVFRKTPFVLFIQVLLPLACFVLILFLPSLFPSRYVRIGAAAAGLGLLLRILWLAVDWWNDIYKIELPYIWDIERKPFGTQEVRTQTDLAGVINVQVSQKGILKLLMNYGDVLIETPGNSATLEFFSVRRPRDVQKEIFRFRELLLARGEKNRQQQTMKQFGEFAEILRQVQGTAVTGGGCHG